MLYRPNFCCQCGEKIARARWTVLTSRRFCDFCAVEQKQHDLFPKVVVAIAVLFGSAGIVAYVGSGPDKSASSPKVRAESLENSPRAEKKAFVDGGTNTLGEQRRTPLDSNTAPAVGNRGIGNNLQRQTQPNSSTEAVYYCGAMTRKGTPCTRRVKSKGHCWQHSAKSDIGGSPD